MGFRTRARTRPVARELGPFGGRGHWSYGLEKLETWKQGLPGRKLLVLSGTKEHQMELHGIGNICLKTTDHIAELLKIGGIDNMTSTVSIFENIISDVDHNLAKNRIINYDDPYKWNWELTQAGPKVGVILYRALFIQLNRNCFNYELASFRTNIIYYFCSRFRTCSNCVPSI